MPGGRNTATHSMEHSSNIWKRLVLLVWLLGGLVGPRSGNAQILTSNHVLSASQNIAGSWAELRFGESTFAAATNLPLSTVGSLGAEPAVSFASVQTNNLSGSATGAVGYIEVGPGRIAISGEVAARVTMGPQTNGAAAAAALGTLSGFDLAVVTPFPYRFGVTTTVSPSVSDVERAIGAGASVAFGYFTDQSSVWQTNLTGFLEIGRSEGVFSGATIVSNSVTVSNSLSLFLRSRMTTFGVLAEVQPVTTRSCSIRYVVVLDVLSSALLPSLSPAGLVLRWPSDLAPHVVECSTNLADAASWGPVSGSLVVSNGFNVLTVPFGGSEKTFYRLRR